MDNFDHADEKKMIRWFVGIKLVLIGLAYWIFWKKIVALNEWAMGGLTKLGAGFVVVAALFLFLKSLALLLIRNWVKHDAFRKSAKDGVFWLTITLRALIHAQLAQLAGLLGAEYFAKHLVQKYSLFYTVLIRTNFVTAVLIVGVALYLFKKRSKFLYGLSEVALAITSNSAIILRLDIEHFPLVPLKTSDVVPLMAFTYLLSRGISNVAEGIHDYIKKKYPDEPVDEAPDLQNGHQLEASPKG